MLIKRNLFSTYIDEYGDERLYSTGELILDEEDYLNELMYSDLEERGFASIRKARKMVGYLKRNAMDPTKFSKSKRYAEELVKTRGWNSSTFNPELQKKMARTGLSTKNLPTRQLREVGVSKDAVRARFDEVRPHIDTAVDQKAKALSTLSPQQQQARDKNLIKRIRSAQNWGELGGIL